MGTDPTTKVGIVEDNATLRQCLIRLIDNAPGLRCVCDCASAEEALAKIPIHRPDVVLMDIHLPGESGIACTARLRQMTSEVARMLVRSFHNSPASAESFGNESQLTERELEVLALVAKGLSNKEIGARLHIAEATVARHLVNVFDKLHVRCRTEAATKYLQSNSAPQHSNQSPVAT